MAAQTPETVTAEQVIERSQRDFPSVDQLDCPRQPDEVVICGKRNDTRYRLLLPVEREPGQIGPDDRFTTDRLMNLNGDQACTSNQGCGEATIPILPMIFFVGDKVLKALRNEPLEDPPAPYPSPYAGPTRGP